MYCKNCGKLISDDSIFCKYCGTKLSDKNSNRNINQFSSNNKNSSGSSFWGVVFTIGLIILICYFIGSYSQSKTLVSGSSTNNKISINQVEQPEPETGAILDRTFQYQGGGHLIATAESNSAVITVTSTEDSSQYLCFYVRKGETADMSIPTGVYTITYTTGNTWYGKEIGFGVFSNEGYFEDTFEFSFYQDHAWISNTIWEITV